MISAQEKIWLPVYSHKSIFNEDQFDKTQKTAEYMVSAKALSLIVSCFSFEMKKYKTIFPTLFQVRNIVRGKIVKLQENNLFIAVSFLKSISYKLPLSTKTASVNSIFKIQVFASSS